MDGHTLIDTARPIVERHARRGRLDRADADDLLQAVAEKYLRTFTSEEPRNVAAWLERTTQRAACDLHRARRRRPQDALPEHGEPNAVATLVAAWREATSTSFGAMKQDSVDRALVLLGPADREVFVRRYLRGESSAHVAADLGLTVNAVDQRARRARLRLGESLAQRPGLLHALAQAHPQIY